MDYRKFVHVCAVVVLSTRVVAADCASVRAHDEAVAKRWNLDWGLAFTGATIIQAAGALTPVNDRERDVLLVGAAKSGLGALSHAILPLVIPDTGNCAADLREAAKREKATFWLSHIGSIGVNLAGALVLWKLHSFSDAAVSVAIGYPVGLLHAYTSPRRAWHVMVSPTGLGVSGEF